MPFPFRVQSLYWLDEPWTWSGVGEVYTGFPWPQYKGETPPTAHGHGPYGTQAQFQEGAVYDPAHITPRDPWGLALACTGLQPPLVGATIVLGGGLDRLKTRRDGAGVLLGADAAGLTIRLADGAGLLFGAVGSGVLAVVATDGAGLLLGADGTAVVSPVGTDGAGFLLAADGVEPVYETDGAGFLLAADGTQGVGPDSDGAGFLLAADGVGYTALAATDGAGLLLGADGTGHI